MIKNGNCYYLESISNFEKDSNSRIKNKLIDGIAGTDRYGLETNQNFAWDEQIKLLKDCLNKRRGYIGFEYSIPRCGRRIDNVLIINNHLILLEFKVGNCEYDSQAEKQLLGYMKDLYDFHSMTHHIDVFSILISTEAKNSDIKINTIKNYPHLYNPIYANKRNLKQCIDKILKVKENKKISLAWFTKAKYSPTPSILEVAHALYLQKDVKDITSRGASNTDIAKTTNAILKIIAKTRNNKNCKKSIIFVTGVPGSGKTLVGLNLIQKAKKHELYSYLSGNAPLVKVLQQELKNDIKLRKAKELELKESKEFVHNLKKCKEISQCEFIDAKTKDNGIEVMINDLFRFRKGAENKHNVPPENVVIFDEAQRCWSAKKMTKEHKEKYYNGKSEAKVLLEYMNRRKDWACIVALIGGGQEIHDGDSGLIEWFDCLKYNFKEWNVFYSDKMINREEYLGEKYTFRKNNTKVYIDNNLNLNTSMRSYKAKNLSEFVDKLLECKIKDAKVLYDKLKDKYKIVLTRDMNKAKRWIKEEFVSSNNKFSEKFGILTSSNGKRILNDGIEILNNDHNEGLIEWFLKDNTDVRSSSQLEIALTEFQIQGLELDYSIVCWDYDCFYNNLISKFDYHTFSNSKGKENNNWKVVEDGTDKAKYIKNTYRVLLTRARQGMIIYVPKGIVGDITGTRLPEYFDSTYKYLKSLGIKEI